MTTDDQSSNVSDAERWHFDKAYRERELALKERELTHKIADAHVATRWSPILVAIIGASLAGIANVVALYWSGKQQIDLERQKAEQQRDLELLKSEQSRVLQVLAAKDQEQASRNLTFLLEVGLITSPQLTQALTKYQATKKAGEGPLIDSGYTGSAYIGESTAYNYDTKHKLVQRTHTSRGPWEPMFPASSSDARQPSSRASDIRR